MKCKICYNYFKGKIGLNTHLRTHNITPLEYIIKYEGFEVPKCICGKKRKQKSLENSFLSTCGDEVCIKNTLREKRLEFMKNNPDKTAWRTKNLSYPEKVFIRLLKLNNLDKQYYIIREQPVFPYFIDFAFVDIMLAVEIDGSQHELPERKESDNKKDELLKSKGWRIFRVTAKEVQSEGNSVIIKLKEFIGSDIIFANCGIKTYKTVKQLKKEEVIKQKNAEMVYNNGLTIKQKNSVLSQRRVERPPFNQLQQEIKELGYVGTGKKYNVSDNAIRKWIKTYKERGF